MPDIVDIERRLVSVESEVLSSKRDLEPVLEYVRRKMQHEEYEAEFWRQMKLKVAGGGVVAVATALGSVLVYAAVKFVQEIKGGG